MRPSVGLGYDGENKAGRDFRKFNVFFVKRLQFVKKCVILFVISFIERPELDFRSFAFISEVLMSENKKGGNTANRVRELAQPLCDELGLFLWDVRYEKEGTTMYLRVFIDKDGGVGIDDCEAFSRPFNDILDREDPIPEAYVFEVSSPGLARELRRPEHFEVCIGDEVRVRLIRAEKGEKEFIGTLTAYEKGKIAVIKRGESEPSDVLLSDCAFVRLCDDENLFD